MIQYSRRFFLGQTSAAMTLGLAGMLSADEVRPTESSGELGRFGDLLAQRGETPPAAPIQPPAAELRATEDNILGPYHRAGAPFRAKITPLFEPGDPLVIQGRVWGLDTRLPLAHAMLDVWQANASGRYDNDDPRNPPQDGVFVNRSRMITDEQGYYEFETIHPGRYQTAPGVWRPSHIHYLVRHPGYKQLVTQLYFAGDPQNEKDEFIKKSLIITPVEIRTPRGAYRRGVFDIVLAKA